MSIYAVNPQVNHRPARRLTVGLASTPAEIREAQALRYRVFADEMGARLHTPVQGLDIDRFDQHCRHLLVRESSSNTVIACTRILTADSARHLGGFYSATEFDLGIIPELPGRIIEIGRTCVADGYRQGGAIATLWSGLARFITQHQVDYLFGCASIPLDADGYQSEGIMQQLRRKAMASEHIRVRPRTPVPRPCMAENILTAPMPPLLKAYVRLGARACGEPCRDADFKVADVLMLLSIQELDPSYSRHFFGRHGA